MQQVRVGERSRRSLDYHPGTIEVETASYVRGNEVPAGGYSAELSHGLRYSTWVDSQRLFNSIGD